MRIAVIALTCVLAPVVAFAESITLTYSVNVTKFSRFNGSEWTTPEFTPFSFDLYVTFDSQITNAFEMDDTAFGGYVTGIVAFGAPTFVGLPWSGPGPALGVGSAYAQTRADYSTDAWNPYQHASAFAQSWLDPTTWTSVGVLNRNASFPTPPTLSDYVTAMTSSAPLEFGFASSIGTGSAYTQQDVYEGTATAVSVVVPEPATLALFGVGIAAVVTRRRRDHR